MKRILHSVTLLLPSRKYIFIYWLALFFMVALVVFGMRETSPTSATFYGLKLEGFGFTSDRIVRASYKEMIFHLFTLAVIPSSLIGSGRVFDTFESEFVQFLRYSRSSRFHVELIRMSSLSVALLLFSVPLIFASVLGFSFLNLSAVEATSLFTRTFGILFFLSTTVYLLVTFPGISKPVSIGCGIVLPFILTGIHTFLNKTDIVSAWTRCVPIGLPYLSPSAGSVRIIDGDVVSCYVISLAMLALRLLVCAKTNWIRYEDHAGL